MSDDDVYGNDMMHNLSDDELETALTGRDIEGLNAHPMALFLSDAARSLQDVQPPAPSAALAEFVGIRSQLPLKQQTQQAPPVTEEVLDLRQVAPNRKKRKMMSSAMAFAATTTGKIVLGTSAAVAAVGGAQASGVVDVVPDIASTDSSAPESTTTSSTVATTSDPLPLVSPDVTTPATPSTEVPTTVDVSDQVLVIPVGDAGTVTVMSIDGALSLVTVDPSAGWTIESSGSYEDEVEVVFSDASYQVKLEVEFEHGVFKVKIEDLLTGLETESFYDENGNPIEKPIDDSDDDDSDYDDDSDDDDSDDDDSDDDDDNKSDHDDDDDKSDDDKSDDDKSDDDDDNKSDHDEDDDKSDDDSDDDV